MSLTFCISLHIQLAPASLACELIWTACLHSLTKCGVSFDIFDMPSPSGHVGRVQTSYLLSRDVQIVAFGHRLPQTRLATQLRFDFIWGEDAITAKQKTGLKRGLQTRLEHWSNS